MSRWADWMAIDAEDTARIRAAAAKSDEDEVTRMVEEWIDGVPGGPLHLSMDKMWEPIHRCLTGDREAGHELDPDAGEWPLKLCVLGGELLLDGSRSATLVSATDVGDVARALDEVDEDDLRTRFFALPPDTAFHAVDDEQYECMSEHFEDLVAFFAGAATAGRAVVCTISH